MTAAAFVVCFLLCWPASVDGKKSKKAEAAKADAMADEIFKMMDKDGDGFLSRDEVLAMGKMAASSADAEMFDGDKDPGGVIFDKFDSDKDGKVTRAEADAIFGRMSDVLASEAPKRRKSKRGKADL
mmetsp:Transcript_12592/g.35881  ORF Transcript_12592/g.35881 Transcript_12592/m.35881 type:complete len:127 (-) Transcript_12592:306-686(-)